MRHSHHLFISALVCILTACTTPVYPPSQSLGNISKWKTKIYDEPAVINITAKVQQGSTARIQLLDNEHKAVNIPTSIIITDEDCSTGHQIIIEYYATADQIISKYFTSTIPWNTEVHLKLEQHENSDYTLTINDESINFHKHFKTKSIKILSSDKGLEISKFEYFKK